MRPGRARSRGPVSVLAVTLLITVCWQQPANARDSSDRLRTARSREAVAATEAGALTRRLRSLQHATQELAVAASQAVEAYDAALSRLADAHEAVGATASMQRALALREEQERDRLGRLASAVYRSGGNLAGISVLLSSDGTHDLARRVASVRFVGDSIATSIADLETERTAAAALEASAMQWAVTERDAVAALATARQAVETRLAERQRRLAVLTAERDEVVRALARLHERTVAAEQRLLADAEYPGAPDGADIPLPADPALAAVAAFALAQIGKPYVWAAAGPDAFDCSGLTMRAWEQAGVALPHYSVAQYESSAPMPVDAARAGDLVFYATDVGDPRTIYHVGLVVGTGVMVEAPHPGEPVRLAAIRRTQLLGAARPDGPRGRMPG